MVQLEQLNKSGENMKNTTKIEVYLRRRKEYLIERNILLNVKLNKNNIESEKIDSKIKEINNNMDMALEVFSPHTRINDFTKDELHSLSVQKKNLIEENENIIAEVAKITSELKELDEVIGEFDDFICNEEDEDNLESEYEEYEKLDLEKFSGYEILEKQEIEKQRIARELHDSPIQVLTNCIHKVELCSKVIDIDPIRTKLELEILSNTIRSTINEMRSIIFDLRPMAFDDLGFEITLERIINQIKNDCKMNIDINYSGVKRKINSVKGLTIVRLIQEACNNSVKHSKGKNINIAFEYEDEFIKILVEDDGKGFDISKQSEGFGLSIMKERVYLLDGKFKIESNDKGTKICIQIPTSGGDDSEY